MKNKNRVIVISLSIFLTLIGGLLYFKVMGYKHPRVFSGEYARVHIEKLIRKTYFRNPVTYQSKYFLVFPESLVVNGDLNLDNIEAGYAGLIVNGDLTVKGNIVNHNTDIGLFLYVKGKTSATNLIAGGSSIALNIANIENFTVGHHPGGSLLVNKLKTAFYYSSDHYSIIRDKSGIEVSIDSRPKKIGHNVFTPSSLAEYWYKNKVLKGIAVYYKQDPVEDSYYYFKVASLISYIKRGEDKVIISHIVRYIDYLKSR